MTLLVMYDDVTIADIPSGARRIAAYIDGQYANLAEAQARFPHDEFLSITVLGGDADACDCEVGDLTVAEAEAWVERQLARGRYRPCVYANQYRWESQGLASALAHYGARIRRWIAHYDDVPILPPGYDAKQYATGRVDVNVTADDFFDGPPRPAPKPIEPKGTWHAVLSFDAGNRTWTIHGLPRVGSRLGSETRWASAEVQVDERTGDWRVRGVPYNDRPLGG